MPQPTVILDTCVLLNLLASNEIENIINAFAHKYLICEAVAKETICLRVGDSDERAFEVVQVDSLVQKGVFRICELENQLEESLYVNYASQIDDGEAMSIAIAEVRGYKLATDDRKARRVFLEAIGDASRLFFTSDLIRQWTKQETISNEVLKVVLMDIRQRATFLPPKTDPNFHWWMSILNS